MKSKNLDAKFAKFNAKFRHGIVLMVAASAMVSAQVPKPNVEAATVVKADANPVIAAMKEELQREKELLVLPGMERPYFISYRVEDVKSWEAVANFGALVRESDSGGRYVRVEVRIGDYATDSSSARGDGVLQLGPEDKDAAALKYALWSATDEAYKAALKAYAAKLAALKSFQNPPTADDFTPAKAVVHMEPEQTLQIDRDEWKKRIVEASGLFLTSPEVKSFAGDVQFSSASVSGFVANRYTVDTDGSEYVHAYSGYADSISVSGQAPDGADLSRNNGSTATTAAGLESAAALNKRTIDDLKSVHDLQHAALADAEDYHGPVLFSGDAAADVVSRLFVPNVEADRPEMGSMARTTGSYQSSLHTPVLPQFVTVVDDPTMKEFEGKPLLGAYAVDDEGVAARPVTVVDHGKLVNYLVGREPVKDFPESNGHGRAALGQSAHSKAGVIEVKSSQELTSVQMRAKLLAAAKQQGRDVYEVETLGGELSPRMLYRVKPDGERTLIRGAVFDELDQRSLRSGILAMGGKAYVAQQVAPVPQTTIVPEILFEDVAVKRASDPQAKLPYYPPPSTK
jgi:TldD protein